MKCAEENCPMWMTGFNPEDIADADMIGLGGSLCALAVNAKLGVMRTMVDIIDVMDDLPFLFPEDADEDEEEPERIPRAAAPKGGKGQSKKTGRGR